MIYSKAKECARGIVKRSSELGFDYLNINVLNQKEQGIRIARGVICRENVFRNKVCVEVEGAWKGRKSSLSLDFRPDMDLEGRVKGLKDKLISMPKDSEFVAYPVTNFKDVIKTGKLCFNEAFPFEEIYSSIEKHVGPVRSDGLRVSGFIDIRELELTRVSSTGIDFEQRDNSMQVRIAVDNEKTLSSGVGVGNVVESGLGAIDSVIANAVSEAKEFQELSENPVELTPGDYETVFNHTAAADLIGHLIYMGFFDRRAIDEGRTFLSNNMDTLSFPKDINLSLVPKIEVPGGSLRSLPVTSRGFEPSSIELISKGKIKDTFISPFWGQKNNIIETSTIFDGLVLILQGHETEKSEDWREIVKNTESGIFVNSLWYIRKVSSMDGILTGMTRDGIFEIKDGKIDRAIKNMRWHENPLNVFTNLKDISKEKRVDGIPKTAGGFGSSYLPAIKTGKFHFSSVTKF